LVGHHNYHIRARVARYSSLLCLSDLTGKLDDGTGSGVRGGEQEIAVALLLLLPLIEDGSNDDTGEVRALL